MSSSLPLKFAFIFSISLAGAASFTTTAAAPFSLPRKLRASLSPKPKATASDLLSLLGSPEQADSVNALVARDLFSCFKFLAPFNRTLPTRRSLSSKLPTPLSRSREEIDDLILSPPPPVLELARIAVDSGGDPGAIHRALDPTMIDVMPLFCTFFFCLYVYIFRFWNELRMLAFNFVNIKIMQCMLIVEWITKLIVVLDFECLNIWGKYDGTGWLWNLGLWWRVLTAFLFEKYRYLMSKDQTRTIVSLLEPPMEGNL